jgi:hypothetical protein
MGAIIGRVCRTVQTSAPILSRILLLEISDEVKGPGSWRAVDSLQVSRPAFYEIDVGAFMRDFD